MNKEIKEKWIEALESGKYRKGGGHLRYTMTGGNMLHCCLGVLCELHHQITGQGIWESERWYRVGVGIESGSGTVLPKEVKVWAEMETAAGEFILDADDTEVRKHIGTSHTSLAEINDNSPKEDFSDIIPVIRKYF